MTEGGQVKELSAPRPSDATRRGWLCNFLSVVRSGTRCIFYVMRLSDSVPLYAFINGFAPRRNPSGK
jgi:hypothetical protein